MNDIYTNANMGRLNSRSGARRVSGQTNKGRKSPTPLSQALDEDGDNGSGMHSLAHELAVALMPEPSAGSKLLHEELGIEFDEGAEGIDEQPDHSSNYEGDPLAIELNSHANSGVDNHTSSFDFRPSEDDLAVHFGTSATPTKRNSNPKPYQDPMETLSRDLESTDRFLSQLRCIDADIAHSSSQPSLEKYASDMIRHINDSVRDREGQVRQLVEYEREFRKIAGDVNGSEILGRLDALKDVGILSDKQDSMGGSRVAGGSLEAIQEDVRSHDRRSSTDWETNPDDHLLEEDDLYNEEPDSPSPLKDSFIAPPPIVGPPTVQQMIPHIVYIRTQTNSLSSSLTAISEHAQVNGAANAEAGRKIRALKNKLGGWRSDWDSAERSRLRIEKWEAGLVDDTSNSTASPTSSVGGKRIDARRIVEEHLRAFELALADAGVKTQAIMARS